MNSLWITFVEVCIVGMVIASCETVADLIVKYIFKPLIRRFKKEQQLDHEA